MVPKVAGGGRSFKGAAAYYLHDRDAQTRDRVTFTHTENLPTDDPDKAWRVMAFTAANQNEIKRQAGMDARGRKLAKPVYSYSLSWHPDEQPDPGHMIETARDSLKQLGLDQHQALIVGHNDRDHPHVHVIVNRVSPEDGRAKNMGRDHLTLSKWAERYERRHEQIRCPERVENNRRRRERGEFVRDRTSEPSARVQRRRQRERQRLIKEIRGDHLVRRNQLKAQHLNERDRIKHRHQRERKAAADRHAATRRQEWRHLGRQQARERRDFERRHNTRTARLWRMVSPGARQQYQLDKLNFAEQHGEQRDRLRDQQRERAYGEATKLRREQRRQLRQIQEHQQQQRRELDDQLRRNRERQLREFDRRREQQRHHARQHQQPGRRRPGPGHDL